MLLTLLLLLQALAALGAVALWIAAMYLWFLRNHSSRTGVSITSGQIVLRFAGALVFTLVAGGLRMLGHAGAVS
jgi:hypothetical protein